MAGSVNPVSKISLGYRVADPYRLSVFLLSGEHFFSKPYRLSMFLFPGDFLGAQTL